MNYFVSYMNPPQAVLDLVEHFRRNADDLRSNRYNETELRREFLDPFFEALGWDVNNSLRYSETYKDVVHEPTRETDQGIPDYCFRVGGTPKFYLEAKKPSVRLKDNPEPALQLRRYAWSSKLPLSILSNFDELAIYDCRTAPKQSDRASAGRISYYTFDEYPQKWEEIVSRFSKEAVLQGSFDRFAVSSKAKRGTTEVDAAFLADIEAWRHDLAATIAVRNPNLDQREVNFAVQRTIDRIIFPRICEDRGLESYGQLRALTEKPGIYPQLCNLFQLADKRYNSGLFHFHKEKDRNEVPDTLTPTITVDDARLKPILKKLYYPDSPYAFSHVPADILGQVYEQFLGSAIRITPARQVKVELKPEVKKAGGAYYTPTYIVDYIVKNTVGELLDGKSPKQVANLRVLDPACGSGSFLIGAYQYLLNWYRDRYKEDGPQKHKNEIVLDSVGNWRLTLEEKKKVLIRHIFGVDIDSQAVEVTKLSLLLKVLEGETQLRLFHERALPDLGNNIKCGNSLIGPDFYENQQMLLLDEEDRYRVNVFDWKQGFQEAMRDGGFDAVIGNPPWGGDIDKELEYFHSMYPSTTQDHTDSFKLFIEAGIRLAKGFGLASMIVPNAILRQRRSRDARRLLLMNSIISVTDLGENVFKKVVAPSCIYLAQKAKPGAEHAVSLYDLASVPRPDLPHRLLAATTAAGARLAQSMLEQNPELELAGITNNSSSQVLLLGELREFKCKDAGINYQRVNVGMRVKGNSDLAERLLYEGKQERTIDHMYWKGSDISRYGVAIKTKRFCRPDVRARGNEVIHLSQRVYESAPKILLRQTADTVIAAMDYAGIWFGRSLISIVKEGGEYEPEYLLGLLNSKYLRYIYESLAHETGRVFAQVKLSKLRQLPIRTIDFSAPIERSLHDRLVELVKLAIKLTSQHNAARTDQERTALERQIEATDRQIDKLVYELYGLTQEEISIVESSAKA